MNNAKIQTAAAALVKKHGIKGVLMLGPFGTSTESLYAFMDTYGFEPLVDAALLAVHEEAINAEAAAHGVLEIDVGYQVTRGGQKSHSWVKPADVAAYIVERETAAREDERERCFRLLTPLINYSFVTLNAKLSEIVETLIKKIRNPATAPEEAHDEH